VVRASRFLAFLIVALFVTDGLLYAQTPSAAATAAVDSADVWLTAPTKEALMERFKQRDAAFGNYAIEFDLTTSKRRHPQGEWHSRNWRRRPPLQPPAEFEPPYLETTIKHFLFATHAKEEHMDWLITEVRKDGEKDEGNDNVGHGARYSSWEDTVRTEYYEKSDDGEPPEQFDEGDPRGPQVHKNSSSVPPTILNSSRGYYELCAGIGMSKRIKQIDTMVVRDGLLHVSGKMLNRPWRGESEFEMELTPSLLAKRILISSPTAVEKDGDKGQFKFVVLTQGELQHETAPTTPKSAKFKLTTEYVPADGKPWGRTNKKFDNLRFNAARGHLRLDEFKKMTRFEFPSEGQSILER